MARNLALVLAVVGLLTLAGCASLFCGSVQDENKRLKARLQERTEELSKIREELEAKKKETATLTGRKDELAKLVEELKKADEEQKKQRTELQQIIKDITGVSVSAGPEGNIIMIQDDILFDLGSIELSEKARKTLDTVVVVYLKKYPDQKIRIDGHTDGVPIKVSPFDDNWHLAAMRSHAVMKYLTSKGIAGDRMYISGWGPNRPLVPPVRPQAPTPKNRRVEILLISKGGRDIQQLLEGFKP